MNIPSENNKGLEAYFRVCPCVPVLLEYILGIASPVLSLRLPALLLLLVSGMLFSAYRRSLFLLLALAAGCLWGTLYMQAPWQTYIKYLRRRECRAIIRCQVCSVPNESKLGKTAHLTITSIQNEKGWIDCHGKLLGSFPPQAIIHYGDLLTLDGAILEFDNDSPYTLYSKIEGIRQRCVTLKILEQHPATGWSRYWGGFLQWRTRLAEMLSSGISDEKCAAIYTAMTLGLRRQLSEKAREVFVRSASVHIFSISGLHVTMLCMSMLYLIRRIGIPLRYRALLTLPALLAYVLLSGGAPSALRSYFMAVGMSLAFYRQRRHSNENTLALSGLVLLVVNPLYLLHSGFLFSFILVATLLRGADYAESLTETICERRWWLPAGTFHRRFLNVLRNGCAVFIGSIVAWYGSCGLMMHFNGMISFGSLFVNALLAPFATLLIFSFLPKILLGLAWPQASICLGKCLTVILKGLLILCQLGASDGLYRECPTLSSFRTLCYYLLLFLALSKMRPAKLRLLTFLVLNGLIACNLCRFDKGGKLLAVNGEKSRPACVAFLPGNGKTAIILQQGDRTALKRMMSELKKRGAAKQLHLVLTDFYSAEWSRELDFSRIHSLCASTRLLNHRRNRSLVQKFRLNGTHICPGDNKCFFLEGCKVKITSGETALQIGNGNIRVKNDDGGTIFITLPNGTTYEIKQALRKKRFIGYLHKEPTIYTLYSGANKK
ncbi:MAG: ComEC/Rec2 family competence protein [Victivallales bacterium]|nr:ComEC/Rec2 family competence protein [Victivallales bacterium]